MTDLGLIYYGYNRLSDYIFTTFPYSASRLIIYIYIHIKLPIRKNQSFDFCLVRNK